MKALNSIRLVAALVIYNLKVPDFKNVLVQHVSAQ